jgi:hypothetical protein
MTPNAFLDLQALSVIRSNTMDSQEYILIRNLVFLRLGYRARPFALYDANYCDLLSSIFLFIRLST